MSTEQQAQSGQAPDQSVNEPNKVPESNARSVEDLERRLKETADEAKKYRQANADLVRKNKEAEEKKLQESGEYKKLYEKTLQQLEDERTESSKKVGSLALNQLKSAFKAEAVKAGCARPDALEKLIGVERLSAVMSGSYEVDGTLLKNLIEESQKEYDFTFAKAAPQVRDAVPATSKAEPKSFKDEVRAARTQKELDAIVKKYGL